MPARLGEFDLIDRLRRRTAVARRDVIVGIGDDGALLRPRAGRDSVLAVDTLVAGVHFPLDTHPRDMGWKSLAVNLSDLAAMGAEPVAALLALTLPNADRAWLDAFAVGFGALARRHGVALVGGDTTRGPLSISVTVIGEVPRGRALLRSGARAGDLVCVSGPLGDAAAGLALVQGRIDGGIAITRRLRRSLDRPTPRVALGIALRGIASAAIDVSDGFLADLGHVLRASGVGATVEVARLPASPAMRRLLPDVRARAPLQLAGGDDYELCFTVAERRWPGLLRKAAAMGMRPTVIGRIEARVGLRCVDAGGGAITTARAGYDHFALSTPHPTRGVGRADPPNATRSRGSRA